MLHLILLLWSEATWNAICILKLYEFSSSSSSCISITCSNGCKGNNWNCIFSMWVAFAYLFVCQAFASIKTHYDVTRNQQNQDIPNLSLKQQQHQQHRHRHRQQHHHQHQYQDSQFKPQHIKRQTSIHNHKSLYLCITTIQWQKIIWPYVRARPFRIVTIQIQIDSDTNYILFDSWPLIKIFPLLSIFSRKSIISIKQFRFRITDQ